MRKRSVLLVLTLCCAIGAFAQSGVVTNRTVLVNSAEFKPAAGNGLMCNTALTIRFNAGTNAVGVSVTEGDGSGNVHVARVSNFRYMYEGKAYAASDPVFINKDPNFPNTVIGGGSCEVGLQYKNNVVWIKVPLNGRTDCGGKLGVPMQDLNSMDYNEFAKVTFLGVRNCVTNPSSTTESTIRYMLSLQQRQQTTQQTQTTQQQQTSSGTTNRSTSSTTSSGSTTSSRTTSGSGMGTSTSQQQSARPGSGQSTSSVGQTAASQRQQQQTSANREFEQTKQRAIAASNARVQQSQQNLNTALNSFGNAIMGMATEQARAREAREAREEQERAEREEQGRIEREAQEERARAERSAWENLTSLAAERLGNKGIAYVDANEVMNSMPEMQLAKQKLENYQSEANKQMDSIKAEFNKKLNDYQQNRDNMTDAVNGAKQKELEGLLAQSEQIKDSTSYKLQKLQEELMPPLLDKTRQAIEQAKILGGFSVVVLKDQMHAHELPALTDITSQAMAMQYVTATGAAAGQLNAGSANNEIAYFDLNEIVASMPELKLAQQALENYQSEAMKQIENMQAELSNKINDYDQNIGSMTDAVKQSKIEELKEMQAQIEQKYNSASDELQKLQETVMKPVYDKANRAVTQVKTAGGFSVLLQKHQIANTDLSNLTDLAPQVKQQLGIK